MTMRLTVSIEINNYQKITWVLKVYVLSLFYLYDTEMFSCAILLLLNINVKNFSV